MYEMRPGAVITIPPGYAHMQINPSSQPSITAGLYGRNIKPLFDFYKNKRGFAYYILESSEGYEVVGNSNYPTAPPLRWLDQLQGTQFEAVESDTPLWLSFNRRAQDYQFLVDSTAVGTKFLQNVPAK